MSMIFSEKADILSEIPTRSVLLAHNTVFIAEMKIGAIPMGMGHEFFHVVHIQIDFAGIAVPIFIVNVMVALFTRTFLRHVDHLVLLLYDIQANIARKKGCFTALFSFIPPPGIGRFYRLLFSGYIVRRQR